MPNANRRNLSITKRQAQYLQELISDDVEDTDLTPAEIEQANSVLARLDQMLPDWPEPPSRNRG